VATVAGVVSHKGGAVKPSTFCHQALEVLRLPGQRTSTREQAAIETLLTAFIADDVSAECFDVQLRLLAESDLCPCLSRAAERVLECWQAERERTRATLAGARAN
jgi:hypothetical protein